MQGRHFRLTSGLILPLLFLSVACTSSPRPGSGEAEDIEELRRIERERLRSLVAADLATARRLHADDFHVNGLIS